MRVGDRVKILPGEPGEPTRLSANKVGVITDIDKFVMGFVGVHLDEDENIIRAFPLSAIEVIHEQ